MIVRGWRTPPNREPRRLIFSGLVCSVGFVLTTTWLMTTAVTGYYSSWVPLPTSIAVSVICGLVIFGNQFVLLGRFVWAATL